VGTGSDLRGLNGGENPQAGCGCFLGPRLFKELLCLDYGTFTPIRWRPICALDCGRRNGFVAEEIPPISDITRNGGNGEVSGVPGLKQTMGGRPVDMEPAGRRRIVLRVGEDSGSRFSTKGLDLLRFSEERLAAGGEG